ncbi:hypothetical protein SAMN05216266_11788 [Amycolatopsis marina]|uniref:DDE superfamily endonuclease n=1 Tax=Amycolatopsis marina TaxID=490629 RepID=A0A1I1BTA6_9PSEU|nr:hypothetical protein [Amycolatopsis marina]SFB53684.1 hypothetical protein SAMN05216266_11788 [Amycolatopsis marina]
MTTPIGLREGPVYLGYNATTPVDPRGAETFLPHLTEHFGNPSSSHLLLLDHIGSHHSPIHFRQLLQEKLTVRKLGDYQTRRPLPPVQRCGFVIHHQHRLKAGTGIPSLVTNGHPR